MKNEKLAFGRDKKKLKIENGKLKITPPLRGSQTNKDFPKFVWWGAKIFKLKINL